MDEIRYLLLDVTGCDCEALGIVITDAELASAVAANCEEYCEEATNCEILARLRSQES